MKGVLKETRDSVFDGGSDDQRSETHGFIAQVKLLLVSSADIGQSINEIIGPDRSPAAMNRAMTSTTPGRTRGTQPDTKDTSTFNPAQNGFTNITGKNIKPGIINNINGDDRETMMGKIF